MPNKTIHVKSFSLQPSLARNHSNGDFEIKQWLAPLFAVSSYAYLPELAEFIECLQENGAASSQISQTKHYFIESLFRAYARIRKNNDYMSKTLETIICGLYDGSREKVLSALKNLQYEINNQFGGDLQIGFEVENFRGQIKRIIFSDVYSNFRRLELFISFIRKNYNISFQHIDFIICTFHKNGYPHYQAKLAAELAKNIPGKDKSALITKTQRLRLIVNKDKQLVAIHICKHYVIKNKVIGIFSIYCTPPETAAHKINLPEITRLPGIYEREDTCVSLSYQALTPEGYIHIPRDLPVSRVNPARFLSRYTNHIVTNWKELLKNTIYFIFYTTVTLITAKSLDLDAKIVIAISCCIAGWSIANLWTKIRKKKPAKKLLNPITTDYFDNVEVIGIAAKEGPQNGKDKTMLPSPNVMVAISNLEKAANNIHEKHPINPNNIIKLPML